jgi:hypothetical protein
MRGERPLLRLGEYLVRRACRRLPRDIREERYREWAAELPAILHDPQGGLAPWRAARMLAYAADTLRGSAESASKLPVLLPRMSRTLELFFVLFFLVPVVLSIWLIVQAPGDAQSYANLPWSLLFVAFFVSRIANAPERIAVRFLFCTLLAFLALEVWDAVQAPRDWVNYFQATVLALLVLAGFLAAFRTQWFRRLVARARRAWTTG